MGPREAAVALELLGVTRCVPCHYGTFPILTGTPAQLRELAPGVEVLDARARGDDRAVSERWFGATGRRVPEIAVEGALDVAGALVLDDVPTTRGSARRTRGSRSSSAPRRRRPSTRRSRARRSPRVLSRPTELLELDLAELTYG